MSARAMSVVRLVSPPTTSVAAVVKITKQPWSDALACSEGPLPARCVLGFTDTTRTRGSSTASERLLPFSLLGLRVKRTFCGVAADT